MSTNKTSKSKVSIGIPVYNGEKFIRKRIDSILNQTFKDFELIISDNASADATSEICQEYVKKDKRIKYIRQKKQHRGFQKLQFYFTKSNRRIFHVDCSRRLVGINVPRKKH